MVVVSGLFAQGLASLEAASQIALFSWAIRAVPGGTSMIHTDSEGSGTAEQRREFGGEARLASLGLGANARASTANSSKSYARLRRLQRAGRGASPEQLAQRGDHLAPDAFLQGEAVGEAVDELHNPRETNGFPDGNEGHMGGAGEGEKVMGTHRVKGDIAQDHGCPAGFREAIPEDFRGLLGVAVEKGLAPRLRDARRGTREIRVRLGFVAASTKKGVDGDGHGRGLRGPGSRRTRRLHPVPTAGQLRPSGALFSRGHPRAGR